MKSRRIILLAMIFCLATVYSASAYEAEIKKMSATMAEKIAATEKNKIAVVDFTNLQGDVTELGRFVAEEFSVALAGAGKGFKVVDRTHLKSIIKENKLSATGLIDPETARKLGKITGVDALITGTLTPFGDSVRIAVKILDTSTAVVIDAITGNIAKTEAVKDLLATTLAIRDASPDKNRKGKTEKYLQVIEARGFSFSLKKCEREGPNVTCSFTITSKDQDKELKIATRIYYGHTTIFDDFGNEYQATNAHLSNKSAHSGDVKSMLIADIPTKSSIRFEGFSTKASLISVLNLACASDGRFKVQFRNVPLSK